MSDQLGHSEARRIAELLGGADPADRDELLARECGGDHRLREEVQSMAFFAGASPRDGSPTRQSGGAAESRAPDNRHGVTENQQIGSYRLVREVGRGGMGVVYLALREGDQFRRRVAIKVLRKGTDTIEVLRRFELERRLLAAMNHPGIARLYDGGETPAGLPYFVMEYIEGQPLCDYCDKHRLRIAERLELFRKVCAAVHYAHQNLVVHRDLKPGNILVTEQGEPKLLDFGVAKLINPEMGMGGGDPTAPSLRLMTPEYASPEQVRGDQITTASDVYSLGVLLYELLSGHRPYEIRRRAHAEIERMICEQEPEPPSTRISEIIELATTTITPEMVSRLRTSRPDRLRRSLAGDIDNIVLMAMRKEPQRRYQSADQLADDIRRHLAGLPVLARPDTLAYRFSKFVRRHRTPVAAGVAVAIALCGGLTVSTWAWQSAEVQRDRADSRTADVMEMTDVLMNDFHELLTEVDGAQEAEELLAETALDYLETIDEARGDAAHVPDLDRRIATAYSRVAEIQWSSKGMNKGEIEQALDLHTTALEIRRRLADRSPDDAVAQRDLSASLLLHGNVLRRRGDVEAALAEFEESYEIRKRLRDAAPGDTEAIRDVAVILGEIGRMHADAGRHEQSLALYEESLAMRRALAAESPRSVRAQRDLSVGLLRVAGRLEDLGRLEEVLDLHRESLACRDVLAELMPYSARTRRDAGIGRSFFGQHLITLGRCAEAKSAFEQFHAMAEGRARENPNDRRAQADLALSHMDLGAAARCLNAPDEAAAHLSKAVEIIVPVRDHAPTDLKHSLVLAEARRDLALALEQTGDIERAIDVLQQADGELLNVLALRADPRLRAIQVEVRAALDRLRGSG